MLLIVAVVAGILTAGRPVPRQTIGSGVSPLSAAAGALDEICSEIASLTGAVSEGLSEALTRSEQAFAACRDEVEG